MNLLGRFFLLTMREDIAVPRAEFVATWQALGLPAGLLPRPRSHQDAFRKALPKKLNQNHMSWMDYTGTARLDQYPDARLKTVLINVRPRKDEVAIQTANAAVVFLDGATVRSVALRPLFPEEQQHIADAIATYERIRDIVDGSQTRAAVHKLFATCSTLTYRDGAYLIPASHFEMADRIQQLIRFVQPYSSQPSVLKLIDYIDTPSHRADLREALREHIDTTAQFCFGEAAKLRPEVKVVRKRTRADTIVAEFVGLETTIATYETLLDEDLSAIRATHADLLRSLYDRINRV